MLNTSIWRITLLLICVVINIYTLQFNTKGTSLHVDWVNSATILEKLTKSRKPLELHLYCEVVPKNMTACDNKPNYLNLWHKELTLFKVVTVVDIDNCTMLQPNWSKHSEEVRWHNNLSVILKSSLRTRSDICVYIA